MKHEEWQKMIDALPVFYPRTVMGDYLRVRDRLELAAKIHADLHEWDCFLFVILTQHGPSRQPVCTCGKDAAVQRILEGK